jgi:ubiquinone/menaquinone biosynthesis C-methylase UbiE
MTSDLTNIVWTDPDVRYDRRESCRAHSAGSDIDRLIELAEPRKKDRALDLVTGLGYVALALSPHVESVDAIDPDEEVLMEAGAAAQNAGVGNINFLVGDPGSIPAEAGKYDLVAARMAMRHTADPSKCLREIHRVLKPGGRVVLIDSLKPMQAELAGFLESLEKQRDRSHVRSYDLEEWEAVLDREGFDIDLMELLPREYDFETWAKKSSGDGDSVRMLAFMLHSASPRAKHHFRIVEKDGKPVSFVTWTIIIRACPSP